MEEVLKRKATLVEVKFELLKGEKDNAIGFSITALSGFESKQFCLSLLEAFENSYVEIRIGENKIFFHNTQIKRFCVCVVSQEDALESQRLMQQTNEWEPITSEINIGFKLIANN